jgi:hypothetical protein
MTNSASTTGKNESLNVSVSIIQQAKIQAQVLVPLVKAMQSELGEERANALVRSALADTYRRYGEEFLRAKNEKNVGKIMASAFASYARDDALDYAIIEQSEDAFGFDVTGCRYAEFTRSWASRSSVSCWSAVRTSIRLKGLVETYSSRARKPSCKAPAIATFATSDCTRRIEFMRMCVR